VDPRQCLVAYVLINQIIFVMDSQMGNSFQGFRLFDGIPFEFCDFIQEGVGVDLYGINPNTV